MGHVLKTISLSFKSCLTYTTHPAENYRSNTLSCRRCFDSTLKIWLPCSHRTHFFALQMGRFKRETESMLTVAQDQAENIKYCRRKILKCTVRVMLCVKCVSSFMRQHNRTTRSEPAMRDCINNRIRSAKDYNLIYVNKQELKCKQLGQTHSTTS